eukprot:Gb_01125 [translate_table: standard]
MPIELPNPRTCQVSSHLPCNIMRANKRLDLFSSIQQHIQSVENQLLVAKRLNVDFAQRDEDNMEVQPKVKPYFKQLQLVFLASTYLRLEFLACLLYCWLVEALRYAITVPWGFVYWVVFHGQEISSEDGKWAHPRRKCRSDAGPKSFTGSYASSLDCKCFCADQTQNELARSLLASGRAAQNAGVRHPISPGLCGQQLVTGGTVQLHNVPSKFQEPIAQCHLLTNQSVPVPPVAEIFEFTPLGD